MNVANVADAPLPADGRPGDGEPIHGEGPRPAAGGHLFTTYRVAVIAGDGIGPEVIAAAQRVLEEVALRFGFRFEWQAVLAGGGAIDAYGKPIRDEDVALCDAADAVLLGAVGGPRWDDPAVAGPPRAGAVPPPQGASACSPICVRSPPSPRSSRRRRCGPNGCAAWTC